MTERKVSFQGGAKLKERTEWNMEYVLSNIFTHRDEPFREEFKTCITYLCSHEWDNLTLFQLWIQYV